MIQNNKSILQQAEILYNARLLSEKELFDSNNLFFEIIISNSPVILRVSKYNDKKREHIDFELNWLTHLSNEISNIAKPIYSINDNLYEVIECDEKYIVCVFEKAKGKTIDRKSHEFNETLFFNLGLLTGNMHSSTKQYNDYSDNTADKFAWYNNWASLPQYNTDIDEEVQLFERKYIKALNSLPKSKDVYGIIHADIHTSNFFVDNGYITIFDFDDCEFNWYVNEISMILFQELQASGISNDNKIARTDFAKIFLLSYLKGYIQGNPIDKNQILQIDLFMKYRRIMIYKLVNHYKWDKDYIIWLKNGILLDTPFVEIDYQKIIRSIF